MLKLSFWILWTAMVLSMHAQAATPASRLAAKAPRVKAASLTKVALRPPVLPPTETSVALSDAQLALAEKVFTGHIPCELAAHVTLTPDARSAGRFVLELGREKHLMVPVPTSTGAIRLEDAATGAVWLQLSNKSMLMNQKLGKRLADECMNPDQLRVAQVLKSSPGPGLLDAPTAALAAPQPGPDNALVVHTAATN